MKVAFWSNVRGIGCSTIHLACVSVWYAMTYPMRQAVVFENHKSSGGLESILSKSQVKENPYYRSGGLGTLLRRVGEMEELSLLDLEWMANRYFGERLMYFPIGADLGPEQLNYHLENRLPSVLNSLEKRVPMIWMDLQATAQTNRSILRAADRVVISLPQNRSAWEGVLRNHREIHGKAFYLIGNYEGESEMTRERICEEYGNRPNRIAGVPHSIYLMDAASRGVMIPFLMRCFHSERGDIIFPLAEQLRKMTRELFDWFEEDRTYVFRREPKEKGHTMVADGGVGMYAARSLHKPCIVRQSEGA